MKSIFFFLSLFAADFLLKLWSYHYLIEPVTVFESPFGIDFYLQYTTNRGGAWGMLSSYPTPLLLFRVGVVIALGVYFFVRRSSLFLLCIITGALGNIVDCWQYDHVIDMLHFTFWGNSYGIFNLADLYIFMGAIGLMFSLKRNEKVRDAR